MITNEIYFFKNKSTIGMSESLYNVNDGTLILQVDGDVSELELSIFGNTNLVDDNYVILKTRICEIIANYNMVAERYVNNVKNCDISAYANTF